MSTYFNIKAFEGENISKRPERSMMMMMMSDRGMYEGEIVWSCSAITEREPEHRLPGRTQTLWVQSSWRNTL